MANRDASCIFCKILDGQIPSAEIGRNGGAVAFLDVNPLTEGHALVVPRDHHALLQDLPAASVGDVFALVHEINGRLLERLDATGSTVGINNGDVAGQAVPHLHVHVIPRYPGDGGGHLHSIVKRPSARSVQDVHQLLSSS